MARRRLNDTQALIARPLDAGQSHSIHTEKIDNGYLTRVSTCDPDTGQYKSATVFTKNPPRVTPPKVDGRQGVSAGDGGGSTLREAKSYLGEDV